MSNWTNARKDCRCRFKDARGKTSMTKDYEAQKAALLPCPFCGSKEAPTLSDCIDDELCGCFHDCMDEQVIPAVRRVVCNVNEGGCGASNGYATTDEAAIKKWNVRDTAEIERLRGELENKEGLYEAARGLAKDFLLENGAMKRLLAHKDRVMDVMAGKIADDDCDSVTKEEVIAWAESVVAQESEGK